MEPQSSAPAAHHQEQSTPYLAACVQAATIYGDTPRTLQKAADLAADAARQGAKVVVFPEAFIGGYPRGASFGAVMGSRTDEGREQFRHYFSSAIEVPGPEVDALAEIARANAIHLVMGIIERDGGTLYCSVVSFDPQGRFLGLHRKVMPTAMERIIWGFGDGSTLPVYDTPRGRLGAVICWENYVPLMRMAMYEQRIQVYCAPTADARPVWVSSMQHIGAEGRCFVLSTNQFARRSDFPADYVSALPDDPEAIVCRGGACIVDPFGNLLAGPLWDQAGIITAEIDLRQIARAQFDFDPVGHYSRPDIFSLAVDTRPKRAVRLVAQAPGTDA